jgi:pyrimidine operon attenuation protein/uracil phosphoribosyltransferase
MKTLKSITPTQIHEAISRVAQAILRDVHEPRETWALVGIHRRGVFLAERLRRALQGLGVPSLPMGSLDITFYRDDRGESPLDPVVHDTDIPFDVAGKTIFLVDDVLYTGRTIRCALDELMDFGRPRRIYLVVLVDRGHRELPIQADFSGETLTTALGERIDVHLAELDKEDAVWITSP